MSTGIFGAGIADFSGALSSKDQRACNNAALSSLAISVSRETGLARKNLLASALGCALGIGRAPEFGLEALPDCKRSQAVGSLPDVNFLTWVPLIYPPERNTGKSQLTVIWCKSNRIRNASMYYAFGRGRWAFGALLRPEGSFVSRSVVLSHTLTWPIRTSRFDCRESLSSAGVHDGL